MKVYKSFSSLTYFLIGLLFLLCTYGFVNHLQNSQSPSIKSWIGGAIVYGLLFLFFLYVKSMSVILEERKVIFKTLFERKEVCYEDIRRVEIQYLHKNIPTAVPYIHVSSSNDLIEIPALMFEKAYQEMCVFLQRKCINNFHNE
ncbi:hypothetical protein ACFOU2_11005 [Bacillus songklensis]|uniref:Uncharacterized protein n=1 Tax=Bacillus songklensis TaxID=1069116 RepID=A0ABV8B1A7_9BACI